MFKVLYPLWNPVFGKLGVQKSCSLAQHATEYLFWGQSPLRFEIDKVQPPPSAGALDLFPGPFSSSLLLLVVWPGAPSSVLAPSSDARSY